MLLLPFTRYGDARVADELFVEDAVSSAMLLRAVL